MNALWWGSLGLLVLMLGGAPGQAKALGGFIDASPILASCQTATSFEGAPPGTCQGAPPDIEDADSQKRKEYVKRALSKSAGRIAGVDLSGKQLVRAGSGFFVSEDGALVTNAQLIDECALISISPTFGEVVTAMPAGIDRTVDLALLRPDVAPPGIASFTDSDGALYGEPTYVIGYPSLGAMTAEPTLAPVRIVGSQKTVRGVSAMAIEGPVLSGNNGGALLDSSGGVIGIVQASTNETYAATGSRSSAVGLVLPNETLQHFLQEHGVPDRSGLKTAPKSRDRLLIDARRFMAQVGCWH
jgi:S1-C subfamily serine protease